MTKRNLLLVSLFLVFGVVATATSALAGTQWIPGSSPNNDARSEGLAEETGIYSLTNNVIGTIAYGDYFTVTYNVPFASVLAGTVYLQCTGPDFTSGCGTPSASVAATLVNNGGHAAVKILFTTSPYSIYAVTGDEIAVVVRFNASLVTCGTYVNATGVATNSNTAGTETISITGTPNQAFPVAYVQCGPSLSLTFGTTETNSSGRWRTSKAADVLSCIGVQDVSTYDNHFCINVDEAFPNALTSESFEIASDPGSGSGTVTGGTTFTVTFPDVPTGIWIEWQSTTPCYLLNSNDPFYCSGGSLGVSGPGMPSVSDNVGSNPPTKTVSFTFTTISEDAGSAENMDICFKFWSRGQLPPGYEPVTAQVSMGPTVRIPDFTGTVEATQPSPLDVIDISDCQTFLLFPYVTDLYGYDTGISISNTTLDPFATDPTLAPYLWQGSAKPQDGGCTIYVYQNGALYTSFPTGTIMHGSTFSFLLAGPAPGTNGYAFAVCNFQNAHGQATIQYSDPGTLVTETGYLADVIPDPQWYHRSPAGDALGETAIAPYLLDRRLVKEIGPFNHH